MYNYASKNSLLTTAYVLLGVASLFFIARAALRTWHRKLHIAEESALFIAYVLFVAMTILYVVAASKMYDQQYHEPARSTWSQSKSHFVRRVFFTNNLIFWSSLWAIKFAFLAMFRRQLSGSKTVLIMWWSLVAFCGLTFAGAVVSNFTSCHNWHGLWNTTGCSTAQDERSQRASLYYALVMDVLTDISLIVFALYVMGVPWKDKSRQVGFALVAMLSLVCIAAAVLRAVAIHPTTGMLSLPPTSSLALWSIVEAAIAVMIGCCPGLSTSLTSLSISPKSALGSNLHQHRQLDSRGCEMQSPNGNPLLSMEEIMFDASRGHSRITSINDEIVGFSRPSQTTSTAPDGSNLKHIPIQLSSIYSHQRSLNGSLSGEFWNEIDSGSRKENTAPQIATAVSKRNSKASLKYTPIQIPGTVGHRRDRAGSLSGAFWGEMSSGERARLDERAKEIKICVKGTKQVRMSEDERGESKKGVGFAV